MKRLLLTFAATLCFTTSAMAGSLTVTRPINNGRWGSQSPTTHPRSVQYTQYAVDVFVPMDQGEVHAVRWSTYTMPGYDDGFKAQVVNISDTCANGGKTVVLRITTSSGAWVGEMAYAHLDSLQVSLWQTIPWYSVPVLGYTRWWKNASCYQVSATNGVHVHMEWGARSPYSASQYGYNAYQPIDFGMGAIYQ